MYWWITFQTQHSSLTKHIWNYVLKSSSNTFKHVKTTSLKYQNRDKMFCKQQEIINSFKFKQRCEKRLNFSRPTVKHVPSKQMKAVKKWKYLRADLNKCEVFQLHISCWYINEEIIIRNSFDLDFLSFAFTWKTMIIKEIKIDRP